MCSFETFSDFLLCKNLTKLDFILLTGTVQRRTTKILSMSTKRTERVQSWSEPQRKPPSPEAQCDGPRFSMDNDCKVFPAKLRASASQVTLMLLCMTLIDDLARLLTNKALLQILVHTRKDMQMFHKWEDSKLSTNLWRPICQWQLHTPV